MDNTIYKLFPLLVLPCLSNLVEGSEVQGCYVEYKCLRTNFNDSITIIRTSEDTSTASNCLTGIHINNYNVMI